MPKQELAESPLSDDEQTLLRTCEKHVEQGLAQFIAVGRALLAIRDKRLYRAEYRTFGEYCDVRWQFSEHGSINSSKRHLSTMRFRNHWFRDSRFRRTSVNVELWSVCRKKLVRTCGRRLLRQTTAGHRLPS